jgi:hypothetical protein
MEHEKLAILHCCNQMEAQINVQYKTFALSRTDSLIAYNEVMNEYGIKIFDGGDSSILINYCPWCGNKLPESQSDRWFAELEKMGYDSPLFQEDIPERYKTSEWRT